MSCSKSTAYKPDQILSSLALQHGLGNLGWCKRYPVPTFIQLLEKVNTRLARLKSNLLHYTKTSGSNSTLLFIAFYASSGQDSSCIILVDSNAPHSLPRSLFIAGGFSAVIFSLVVSKKRWAGGNLGQRKTATNRILATTGIAAWA